MTWSTREVADLAGTSLRTVRHYHEIGLLDEPERRTNGYKQYGVAHLVRLMRIRRLTELGFTLAQVAAIGDTEDHPAEAIDELDAELAATIERLRQARDELAVIRRRAVPPDLPAGFAAVDPGLSAADRSFIVVLAGVLGPRSLETYVEMLRDLKIEPSGQEFDDLPADAAEEVRQDLAVRMFPFVVDLRTRFPALTRPPTDAPRGVRFAQATVGRALVELYNPAQLDVMKRIEALLLAP
ncbi:MerR family transcriptional regulator [Actinoplanes sp. TRM 88003]|uniref:MerR family transcriptional regulator n=1 Tax=Paractinoplanes aksuensis TaxID=2939490 RepID=A0ABT1E375_9ACTN|nr:MerR family transcriptional regulator [Actinoplanes aksuensis]MCO8276696.1 MerR family transcriptional regulator [Actinoplanes aksuensis]